MAQVVGEGIVVTRLSGSLGASVSGLDLSRRQSDETIAWLRQLMLEHLVLVFPGQGHITPAQHAEFAGQWGPLQRMPVPMTAGRDDLLTLASGPGIGVNAPLDPDLPEAARLVSVDIWHSDQSFEPEPPVGSFLLMRELPAAGGDTMFANQYLAYDTLSAPMRAMLDQLQAWHSGEGMYIRVGKDPAEAPRHLHPVVRTHPETGRNALYINRIYTKRIDGMSDAESKAILAFLYEHCAQPRFTMRHRWSLGDLLMWDNRCTQHNAVRDYGNDPRVVHRATVLGDRPYFGQPAERVLERA